MAAAVVPGVLRTVSALTGIRGAGLPGLTTRAEPRGRVNRDTRGGGATGVGGGGTEGTTGRTIDLPKVECGIV
eukprot:scaffold52207_cov59-Phaeocystis_antarctica.AAC.1